MRCGCTPARAARWEAKASSPGSKESSRAFSTAGSQAQDRQNRRIEYGVPRIQKRLSGRAPGQYDWHSIRTVFPYLPVAPRVQAVLRSYPAKMPDERGLAPFEINTDGSIEGTKRLGESA